MPLRSARNIYQCRGKRGAGKFFSNLRYLDDKSNHRFFYLAPSVPDIKMCPHPEGLSNRMGPGMKLYTFILTIPFFITGHLIGQTYTRAMTGAIVNDEGNSYGMAWGGL